MTPESLWAIDLEPEARRRLGSDPRSLTLEARGLLLLVLPERGEVLGEQHPVATRLGLVGGRDPHRAVEADRKLAGEEDHDPGDEPDDLEEQAHRVGEDLDRDQQEDPEE